MRSLLAREQPSATHVMLATVIGAAAVVLVDAVAIALVVPLPAQGWSTRIAHHAFDALNVMGLAFLWATVAGLCAWRRWPWRWVGWLLLTVLAALATDWSLGHFVQRKAHKLIGGAQAEVIYRAVIAAYGLGIVATYWVGGFLGRRRVLRWLPLIAGLGALCGNQLLLLDEYQGVHTVVAWAAACFFGAAIAVRVPLPLTAPRRRALLGAGILCVALMLALPPPNSVRIEIFRHAGTSTSIVLARALWRPPKLTAKGPDLPPAAATARRGATSRPTSRPAAKAPAAPGSLPVVVLITVEAMRGDVLAGAHDDRLLELARLRDRAAYFRHAWAPGSQTSTSLATLFSGRYFSQLRWKRLGAYVYPKSDPSPRFPALLGEHGVRTRSYLGLQFIDGAHGIADGFQQERVRSTGAHLAAETVLRPLLADLARADRSRSHFFYAHLTEPHEPYDRGSQREGPAFERYLSEVALVGRWIARVARQLEWRFGRRGVLIVAADHGEAFGEHGTYFHSRTLYEELLWVPLLFLGPAIEPRAVDARVSLVDLGPTILELHGVAVPDSLMGRSLWPMVSGRARGAHRTLFAEGRLRRAMLSTSGIKVIEDTRLKTVEVYDLARDPGERHNLFDAAPARAHPPVARLRAFFRRHAYREPGYETPYKR